MSAVAQHIEALFVRPFRELDPLAALQDALLRNHEEILDINRQQLLEGENATTGAPLQAYKPFRLEVDPLTGAPLSEPMDYAEYKAELNPDAHGDPDLRLTGAFHAGFFLIIGRAETAISSHDEKTQKLERQYGRDLIFGVQPRNYIIIAYYIRRQLELNWRRQLNIR